MDTIENNTEDVIADVQAVADAVAAGRPVDPEVARRVHERAAKITEEIRRTHGEIDDATFQSLLQDDDAEET
jgi:hypothetical protein